MKQTLMMITAVALASFAMAETYIEPGNIVGYTKMGLTGGTMSSGGFTLFGMSFEECGGGEIKINDLTGNFFGGIEYDASDNLLVYDKISGEYKFYYFGDSGGSWGADYDNKWYWQEDDNEPTEDKIAQGGAAWLVHRNSASELATAGQVGTNDVPIAIASGFRLVGNPFPVDIAINSLQGSFFGGIEYDVADNLMLYDKSTGEYKFYYFGDSGGSWGVGYDNQWYWQEDDNEPTTDKIPPSGSFWIVHKGSGCTLTILAPVID